MQRSQIVRLLLEKGADVNITGKDGKTLLQLAEKRADPHIVELVAAHGAKR